MNKPQSSAEQVLAAVQQDPTVQQLRTRLQQFESKLQSVQQEIADATRALEAQLNHEETRTASLGGDPLADLDTLVRPTPRTTAVLRDTIRQGRLEEAELAEAVRIVRGRIRQCETDAYYKAFTEHLVPEQIKLGARSIDLMLSLAEVWHEEQALREPLKAVSRFEVSDIWAVHYVAPALIRDFLERLEKRGYEPTTEQRKRLAVLLRNEP